MHSIAALVATCSLASAATLISVDLNRDTNSITYSGAAVLAEGLNSWNGIIPGTSVTNKPLSWSDNTSSPVTLSISSISGTYFSSAATTSAALMNDYAYLIDSTHQKTSTITISGLPSNSTGTIVLYAAVGAKQGSAFSLTDASNITFTGQTKDDQTTYNGLTKDDQYVEFDNVDFGQSGQVTINWGFTSNPTTQYAALNGLQIQIVPEPSTALLVGVGMLGLLTRRRRRS
jgi:hypothetical protein